MLPIGDLISLAPILLAFCKSSQIGPAPQITQKWQYFPQTSDEGHLPRDSTSAIFGPAKYVFQPSLQLRCPVLHSNGSADGAPFIQCICEPHQISFGLSRLCLFLFPHVVSHWLIARYSWLQEKNNSWQNFCFLQKDTKAIEVLGNCTQVRVASVIYQGACTSH